VYKACNPTIQNLSIS